jgi:hypothetical protein
MRQRKERGKGGPQHLKRRCRREVKPLEVAVRWCRKWAFGRLAKVCLVQAGMRGDKYRKGVILQNFCNYRPVCNPACA